MLRGLVWCYVGCAVCFVNVFLFRSRFCAFVRVLGCVFCGLCGLAFDFLAFFFFLLCLLYRFESMCVINGSVVL